MVAASFKIMFPSHNVSVSSNNMKINIKQYLLSDASSQQIPIDDALYKRKDNKTLNLLMYG